MSRLALVVAVVCLLTAGAVIALPTTAVDDAPAATPASVHLDPPELGLAECAATPPADHADPEEDVLGWYDGYWYDEPIDVDQSDGLSDDELDAVVARTMARWEALRCLPFDHEVDIDVIDRETFQDQHLDRNVSDATRQFDNARAQALFLVNESADAIEVEAANRGETVQGFYSIANDEIVLVTDEDDVLQVSESTLAHELGHALQAQHFGFDDFGANTTDQSRANLGLIEGDVVFTQRVYESHCEIGAWAGDCLEPDTPPQPDLANIGLFLKSFQPYSDGPHFIAHRYDRGGWASVDSIYDRYPFSMKEVMYPDRYGEFEPAPPDLEDRSTDDWVLIDRSDGPHFDQLGEGSFFTAFIFPALDRGEEASPIEAGSLINWAPDGQVDPINPYNYSHPLTDGWVGDRFKAYSEAGDGESLAFTFAVSFEDDEGAMRFTEGYTGLLGAHDAVDEGVEFTLGEGTALYTIDDTADFAGAYWLERNDETVQVVHAPSIETLHGVHDTVDIGDDTATPTPTPSSQSGFGSTAAVLGALIVLSLLAHRARR